VVDSKYGEMLERSIRHAWKTKRARHSDALRNSDRYEILRHGGGGESTTVICGVVRFDHPAAHHLIRLLPK